MNLLKLQQSSLLIIIFVTGFLLRVSYALTLEDRIYFGDGADYVTCAMNLVQGNGFSILPETTRLGHVPPFYPLFLAGIFLLFGQDYFIVRLIQAIVSSLTAILIYYIGRETYNQRVGIISAIITAIYPYLIYHTNMEGTETLCIFLIAFFVLFSLKAVKRYSKRDAMAVGLLLGLSTLTRPVFLLFLPFVLLYILWVGQYSFAKKIITTSIMLLTFVLVLTPYAIRNYVIFHRFVPVTLGAGVTLYQQAMKTVDGEEEIKWKYVYGDVLTKHYFYPKSPEDEYKGQQYLLQHALTIIKQHSLKFLGVMAENFQRFWSFYPTQGQKEPDPYYKIIGLSSYGLLFPFFIVGIIRSITTRKKSSLIFFFLLIYLSLLHSIFYGMLRYRMPIETVVILLSAYGVAEAISFLQNRYLRRSVRTKEEISS